MTGDRMESWEAFEVVRDLSENHVYRRRGA
jgi:hypothetical protein